jgi:4-azaleucine resistance transporter AzlC
MRHEHKDYWDGIVAILPVILGSVPFGIVAGAVAAQLKFPAAAGISQSFILYAGSAQLAANQFMKSDATTIVAILTGLIVNLRLAMYSAAIAPHFKGLSTRYRAFLAYILTDQSFAVCILRYTKAELLDKPMSLQSRVRFYVSGAVLNWFLWCVAVAAGFFLGAGLPPSWSLDFFVPLSFLALLVPGLRDRPSVVAAVTGGSIAVLAHELPFNLGLFLAASCGIAAGYLWETRTSDKTRSVK